MNMNLSSNYKKAYNSDNSNNEKLDDDLETKVKIQSTNIKQEDDINKNLNKENFFCIKNNNSEKTVNLGIMITDESKSKKYIEDRKKKSEKRKQSEKNQLKKSINRGGISMKYKIFLITLWIVFFSSFIVGFITHFEIKLPITASGIIWCFSFIMLIVAVIYSHFYYKICRSDDVEEKIKLLKNFPF